MNYGAKEFLAQRRRQRIERRGGQPEPIAAMFCDPVVIIDVKTYREIVVKSGVFDE